MEEEEYLEEDGDDVEEKGIVEEYNLDERGNEDDGDEGFMIEDEVGERE